MWLGYFDNPTLTWCIHIQLSGQGVCNLTDLLLIFSKCIENNELL
jgi:hypothetical protein